MIRKLSRKEKVAMEENYRKLQGLMANTSISDKSAQANESAKEVLENVYQIYSQLSPDKKYSTNEFHSAGYMFYMAKVRLALVKNDYARAVHQLSNMLYRNSTLYLQPRIYYNVIKVLEEYVVKK